MAVLDELICLMLQKAEVKGVDKQELDDFLLKNHLNICNDYYQFLLNCGNSDFLTSDFADLRFLEFKDYYLNYKDSNFTRLPKGHHYIGMDFNDVLLCKKPNKRCIYTFGHRKKDEVPYYGGIQELLFFSLLKSYDKYDYFDEVIMNNKIIDIENFKEDGFGFEIAGIHAYERYFLKDRDLIVCDDKFYYCHLYQGGILSKLMPTTP